MSPSAFIFIPLAAIALIAAALCVARLARAWKAGPSDRAVDENRGRIALLDEKSRLLMTLKDLEQEHLAGKLSDADYRVLEARFQGEALQVIKKLEAQ